MFGALGNLGSLVKQAQELGGRLQALREQLRNSRVTGSSGGGMVQIEANGLEEILACRIDQSLISQMDRELLEDLTVAAVNDALAKAKELHAQSMQSMAGGLQIPGLSEALARLVPGDTSGS